MYSKRSWKLLKFTYHASSHQVIMSIMLTIIIPQYFVGDQVLGDKLCRFCLNRCVARTKLLENLSSSDRKMSGSTMTHTEHCFWRADYVFISSNSQHWNIAFVKIILVEYFTTSVTESPFSKSCSQLQNKFSRNSTCQKIY